MYNAHWAADACGDVTGRKSIPASKVHVEPSLMLKKYEHQKPAYDSRSLRAEQMLMHGMVVVVFDHAMRRRTSCAATQGRMRSDAEALSYSNNTFRSFPYPSLPRLSPLTPHPSPLTLHPSPFIPPPSSLIPHPSSLSPHPSSQMECSRAIPK